MSDEQRAKILIRLLERGKWDGYFSLSANAVRSFKKRKAR
jgi:hypothetical protein